MGAAREILLPEGEVPIEAARQVKGREVYVVRGLPLNTPGRQVEEKFASWGLASYAIECQTNWG